MGALAQNKKNLRPLFQCIHLLKSIKIWNSASSGNSGELTTVKNLKRSKNKGRKKKAKTKQSQGRSNKVTEPIQEVQESSIPTLEQTPTISTDLKNAEDTATIADDKNLANKQTTGKWKCFCRLN